MKLIQTILIVLILQSCNNGIVTTSPAKSNAEAQTMNGIYLFIKSKPTCKYDFLGSIELKLLDKLTNLQDASLQSVVKEVSGMVSFSDNIENTLVEVKKKYPSAEAVIFDDEMSRCEVIKFKD